ncbi:uncharacterized protein C15orf65 homolog, partial [Lacerta agilis]|uniref:uncharacterized protein C15orf65 homolog n=1 Tax=Lacerta agilis TaxID=80427 RepID=UPI00141A29F1
SRGASALETPELQSAACPSAGRRQRGLQQEAFPQRLAGRQPSETRFLPSRPARPLPGLPGGLPSEASRGPSWAKGAGAGRRGGLPGRAYLSEPGPLRARSSGGAEAREGEARSGRAAPAAAVTAAVAASFLRQNNKQAAGKAEASTAPAHSRGARTNPGSGSSPLPGAAAERGARGLQAPRSRGRCRAGPTLAETRTLSQQRELKMTSEPETKPMGGAKKTASFQWRPCANPGNPVFSCMLEAKTLTSSNFLTKPQLLLYKTTSSEYGAIPPTTQMVPCKFCPKDNNFTNHLFTCGMTRFNGINTGTDKNRVCDLSDLMHTL